MLSVAIKKYAHRFYHFIEKIDKKKLVSTLTMIVLLVGVKTVFASSNGGGGEVDLSPLNQSLENEITGSFGGTLLIIGLSLGCIYACFQHNFKLLISLGILIPIVHYGPSIINSATGA